MRMGNGENFLTRVMSNGFNRAAASFSKIIQRSVTMVNSPPVLIRHYGDLSFLGEQGDLYILTTQLIGNISGKSFLIFSSDESKEIFKAMRLSTSTEALKEAFLLEIDNIISASVIAELSNSLSLEIYGDVPQLVKVHSNELQDFMSKEMSSEDLTSMIFCNTTFQFDNNESVHPQFIWKLSSRVFEMIPVEKTLA
jgi:chemotaxis protein CheY-P-specific phosphatase CheC